ncbi:MAG: UDP-N-acetylglucosamine 2-epimerase, partial [Caldilineaceae bacterium]|nr:UDP-N-acetylglucosamine 2-epimerase [Caldilineaceae bacterium]
IQLIEPVGYLDFVALQAHADVVLTDSGGVQEETTYLGTPCLTVRPNTERPVTITSGSNRLVQRERKQLIDAVRAALSDKRQQTTLSRPELWDGKAANRIVALLRHMN